MLWYNGGTSYNTSNVEMEYLGMPATALFETGSLDALLEALCEAIQLSKTQFDKAEDRYHNVGEWLTAPESVLRRRRPEVFPQGSMLQRTTIRPFRDDEEIVPFDLDTVCRCAVDPTKESSKSLREAVRQRLLANGNFKTLIEQAEEIKPPSGKCITLAYLSDDFLLDVVPMCVDPTDDEGIRLLMCNPSRWDDATKPIDTWRHTDPIRFAAWLQERTIVKHVFERRAIAASVAPVPPKEPSIVKAVLRRVVQLLKRRRDIKFLGKECRPTSILLTTLAGNHYGGESSIAVALVRVLDGIHTEIQTATPKRIVVINPADEIKPHPSGQEDLASAMDNQTYAAFCDMISDLRKEFSSAQAAKGPKLLTALEQSFGIQAVKTASRLLQEQLRAASTSGVLGAATAGTGIRVLDGPRSDPGYRPTRSNTFHKDDPLCPGI